MNLSQSMQRKLPQEFNKPAVIKQGLRSNSVTSRTTVIKKHKFTQFAHIMNYEKKNYLTMLQYKLKSGKSNMTNWVIQESKEIPHTAPILK